MKSKILLVTSLLFFLCSLVFAQSSLNQDIAQRMSDGRMPGLAICIVKNGRIALVRGYGWADISAQKPVTPDTIFLMASVSKTITATALMQLYERGLFKLDDDVNKFLPFSVRNPSFPRNAITFRQLMSHVSSIRDRYSVYDGVYSVGDSPIPLGNFLQDYLVPGRKYFRPQNFYPFAPATQYRYSNVGAALGGYLAERISGIDFSEYCKQNIFRRLNMSQTGWFLNEVPAEKLTSLYDVDSSGKFVKLQQYGYPDYPNYQLRTSARQLARFLIAHIQFGKYGKNQILKPETVREMRRIQFPELDGYQGLAFYYYYSSNGDGFIGHSGITDGTTTEMWFRMRDGAGIIMMCNRWLYTRKENKAWNDIFFRLVQEADSL